MGLQDRDYARREPQRLQFPDLTPRRWSQRIPWATALPLVASAIAILSGAVWLARDAQPLFGRDAPTEGTLLVNINSATVEELETLPGIGAARARLIIGHRPYSSIDDLKKISGIPDALVEDLRPMLLVSGETREAGTK
jgi:competence ComEA-like helix-hairpin-helix protein